MKFFGVEKIGALGAIFSVTRKALRRRCISRHVKKLIKSSTNPVEHFGNDDTNYNDKIIIIITSFYYKICELFTALVYFFKLDVAKIFLQSKRLKDTC